MSRVAPLALAMAAAAGGAGIAGAAQLDDADATVQTLREQADHAAEEYFDALARAAELDATIDGLQRRLPDLVRQRRRLRVRAQRRAVAAYMRSGRQLAILIDSDDALTATRRRTLLARLNARDAALFSELTSATRRIQARRLRIERARVEQARTIAELEQRGREIDLKLEAALDRRTQLDREAQEAAAAAEAAQAAAATTTTAPTEAALPEVTTTTAAIAIPTTPPRDYEPTPGTHRHHDDPFLVCTRARESSGNYAAVNREGPYLGAYQFLQSTWNSGANHAGRLELVGVPPNTASEYDQDDIAWVIYQWRGTAPWGDCP